MILAIDVGNTNTVIGAIENEGAQFKLIFSLRTRTNTLKIRQLMEGINNGTDMGLKAHELLIKNMDRKETLRNTPEDGEIITPKFDGAIISSTVPSVVREIRKMIVLFYGIDAMVVNPDMKMNITIPEKFRDGLGSDLIVGLVAACEEYESPVAVIDMGTASTIFAVDKDRNFIGGIIHPGIGIELKALCTNTALLPKINFQVPKYVIGQNTEECIQSGVFYGHAGLIDTVLEHMEKELGQHLNAVATGGLGRCIAPICHRHIEYDEDLLFKGLAILYNNNKKG